MTDTILVAYPTGGENSALKLMESLEPLGSVSLRTYAGMKTNREGADYGVVLCVVVDDVSVRQAHDLQKKLPDIPTVVVDHSRGANIPINGFSGLISPIPQQIVNTVAGILESQQGEEKAIPPARPRASARPKLTSRFDATLSRLGGLSSDRDTLLAASARHLTWELRTDRAEAYLIDPQGQPRLVFATPSLEQALPVTESACRVIAKLSRLTTLTELTRRMDAPLTQHLKKANLNVIAPMLEGDLLIGWLALHLDDSSLSDDFLDELNIATHLLSLVLAQSKGEPMTTTSPWPDVLRALRNGLMVISREGHITDLAGDISLLGTTVTQGDSFKAVKNGRVRQVIAEALRQNFVTDTWPDPHSDLLFTCSAHALPDNAVAIRLVHGDTAMREPASSQQIDLQSLLKSLVLPVEPETPASTAPPLPSGSVSLEDSLHIRRCAEVAKSRNIKALKMRFKTDGSSGRGVLFYETPAAESQSHLDSDINQAVRFHVTPA